MKTKFLFPKWCRPLGWLLAIPGFVLGYFNVVKGYEIAGFGLKLRDTDGLFQKSFENLTNELCIFMVIIGLLLIAFAKSKIEDELNARLRLNALYWAVMIYYLVYFAVLLYGAVLGEIPFISNHVLELNLFTPLLIFILRFYYLKHIQPEQYLLGRIRFLPNRPFKVIGVVLSLTSLLALLAALVLASTETFLDNWENIFYLIMVVGLSLWAFAKNKVEDEMVMQQRLESLLQAVYLNYAVVLIATLLLYSLSFLYFLFFAGFSLLLYFVLRMEYVNYKQKRLLNNVETAQ